MNGTPAVCSTGVITVADRLLYSVKFIGYNALMTAIDRDSPADTVDYLVGKGLSPVLTDQIRGYLFVLWEILSRRLTAL